MKSTKFRLIVFAFAALFFSVNLNASNIDDGASKLRKEVIAKVQNPELVKHGITEVKATIEFTLDETNKVKVSHVQSDNDYISKFVTERLDMEKLEVDNLPKGQAFMIDLIFRAE
jgi:hypothetical protein